MSFYLTKSLNLYYFVILITCIVTFSNSIFNKYNIDDELVIIDKKDFNIVEDIFEIFKNPYFSDELGNSYEYRPITNLSFYIEGFLFTKSVHISHTINLAIYTFTCLLIFYLVYGFSNHNVVLGLLTAMLFSVHPIHTEVVCSIKNRDELLSLVFFLTAVYFLLRIKNSFKYSSIALFLFFVTLSILSKRSTSFLSLFSVFYLIYLLRDKKIISLILGIVSIVYVLTLSQIAIKWHYFIIAIFLSVLFLYWYKNIILSTLSFNNHNILFEKLKKNSAYFIVVICFIIKYSFPDTYNIIHTLLNTGVLITMFFLNYKSSLGLSFFVLSSNLVLIEYSNYDFTIILLFLFYFFILLQFKKGDLHFYLRKFPLQIIFPILFFIQIIYSEGTKGIVKSGYCVAILVMLYFIEKIEIRKVKRSALIAVGIALFIVYILIKKNEGYFFISLSMLFFIASFMQSYKYILSSTIVILFFSIALQKDFQKNQLIDTKTYINYIENATNKLNRYNNDKLISINENRVLNFVEYPLSDSNFNIKIGNTIQVIKHYASKLIFPYPLGFYYGYSYFKDTPMNEIKNIIWSILFLFLIFIVIYYFKKDPILSISLAIFILSLVSISNIFIPIAGVAADRLAYSTSLIFCFIISYLLNKNFSVKKDLVYIEKWKFTFIMILFFTQITYSISRNERWENHLTLMRHDITYLYNSSQAHNLLANQLMSYSYKKDYLKEQRKMQEEAKEHFKKALAIYPEFFNANRDLAKTYMILNKPDSAYIYYKKVYEMDSSFSEAIYNIALIFDKKEQFEEASKFYLKTIETNRTNLDAYLGLSYVYVRQNLPKRAIDVNLKAMEINKFWVEPYENLAYLYNMIGDTVNRDKYIYLRNSIMGR